MAIHSLEDTHLTEHMTVALDTTKDAVVIEGVGETAERVKKEKGNLPQSARDYRFLLDRKDLPSAGAGETPLIALAPAVGNAIFQATGVRLRSLPMAPKGVKQ